MLNRYKEILDPIKISLVVITLNEEAKIGACLKSCQSVVDEMIVVDSFSTDKTAQIAEELGARVVMHPFEGHIEQKNRAIDEASFNYILSLDADEALSPELQKSIALVKKNWRFDAYIMHRLTSYCGKWIRHGTWYPDKKVRLFNKDAGNWQGQNPHDKFELKSGKTLGKLKGDILHYTMDSISDHLKQMDFFTEIMAKELYLKGQSRARFKLFISPIAKFLNYYILHAGFMDGYYGFVIALNSAHASFLKYAKLIDFQKRGLPKS